MTTPFVSTMLAVCLLPYISIGDGREPGAAATDRARAMLSLYSHMSDESIVVVGTTVFLVGICQDRYRSSHCYHNCKNKAHFFHCHIP